MAEHPVDPIKHGLRVFLNGFKNEPSHEFIGEVILKKNLAVRDVKTNEKFINNSESVSLSHTKTMFCFIFKNY